MTDLSDARQYLLAFKAGRAFRRENTNFVDPSTEKGAIILYQGDDDLMHFIWKNRTTNNIEEVYFSLPKQP
jgi:26S proteasome regulatory subunit N13